MLSDDDILKILELLEPKIKKSLYQTHYSFRDDLSQELIEKIIKYLKTIQLRKVPGFFEFIEEMKVDRF